jgi:hypothetical protein
MKHMLNILHEQEHKDGYVLQQVICRSGHRAIKTNEVFHLLGYNAIENQLMFQRNMSPPFSEPKLFFRTLLATCFMLVSCLAYSLILKIQEYLALYLPCLCLLLVLIEGDMSQFR